MSRVGRQQIAIPSGVEVNLAGNTVSAKGPKGELSMAVSDSFEVRVEEGYVRLLCKNDAPELKASHGLNRSLVANMIEGVSKGYCKELDIEGVGFRAAVQGKKVVFSLGFSSPVELAIPDGVDISVADNVKVVLTGADKQLVGDVAARIRSLCPAEPYKGKGIRYRDEHVRRKVGKTVA